MPHTARDRQDTQGQVPSFCAHSTQARAKAASERCACVCAVMGPNSAPLPNHISKVEQKCVSSAIFISLKRVVSHSPICFSFLFRISHSHPIPHPFPFYSITTLKHTLSLRSTHPLFSLSLFLHPPVHFILIPINPYSSYIYLHKKKTLKK